LRRGVLLFAVLTSLLALVRVEAQINVFGTVPLGAIATDNVGVVGLQFLLNGAPLGPEDMVEPWSLPWDTTTVLNGVYLISARARDAAGNSATSTPVTVTVINRDTDETPTVIVTSPMPNEVVFGTRTLTATATDDNGVAGVQFLVDGAPLGPEVTSAPYGVLWDTTSVLDGPHVLSAVARDTGGNQALAPSVPIMVDNTVGGAQPEAPTPGPAPEETTAPPAADPPSDPTPMPPPDEEPTPESIPVQAGNVSIEITLSRDVTGITHVRSATAVKGVESVSLSTDGDDQALVLGKTIDYAWDTRNLMGYHELVIEARSGPGNIATTNVFYEPTPTGDHLVSLDLNRLPFVGGTLVGMKAKLPGVGKIELYVDGALERRESGNEIEYGWNTGDSRIHEVLGVAYNATGVVASIRVLYRAE